MLISAESNASGIAFNMIPKEGGNTFNLGADFTYSNDNLQSDNLNDALRARGVTSTMKALEAYDVNVTLALTSVLKLGADEVFVSDGGKTVFLDAKGPSLATQGVPNAVQATQIGLYSGSQLIASNDGWRNNSNVAEIIASGLAPTDDRESALQVALEPGAYTVIVSSGDGSTGIGLVEVYGVGDTLGP